MRRYETQAAAAADWGPAARPEAEDDPLQAAFELSYFIHRDRVIAAEIVLAAMQKLEVAAVAQMRRLYYKGRRGGSGAPNRFKTCWADRHLLQRLVYFESERWERLQEERSPGSLTQEDYLLRFVKHLSQITMKRSSFYASIAIGRILHAFSTAETMAIYDAVAPEGCERKQGDYFRSRKAQLLEEVRERFGELLSIVRGPHQEERIECAPVTSETAGWMRECLRITTPWGTRCLEGEAVHGRAGQDLVDPEEVHRFHSLFHPPCFARLTRRLRLADPAGRLAIPRFPASGRPGSGKPGGLGDRYARVRPEERVSIEHRLGEESRRRRDFSSRHLRVLIDGQERLWFDPASGQPARFAVEEGAEIVEVRAATSDGDLLLAMHPLSTSDFTPENEARKATIFSIVLESGQSIEFRIEREEGGVCTLELTYRETAWRRAVPLLARRLARWARETLGATVPWLPQPVEAALLGAAGALLLILSRGAVDPPSRPAPVGAPAVSESNGRPVGPIVIQRDSNRAAARDAQAFDAAVRPAPGRTDLPPERRRAQPQLQARNLPLRAKLPSELSHAGAAEPAPREISEREKPTARLDFSAITPLSAVRESFLQSLTAEAVAVRPSATRAPRFSDIGREIEAKRAARDPEGAALLAALARSQGDADAFGRAQPRLPRSPAPDAPRVRVLRRVVAPSLSDGARCAPQELACPVARISSANSVRPGRGEPGPVEKLR